MLKRRHPKFSATPDHQTRGLLAPPQPSRHGVPLRVTLPIRIRGTNVARNALRRRQPRTATHNFQRQSEVATSIARGCGRFRLINRCLRCCSSHNLLETEGAFDISSGPLSDCCFLRRQGAYPSPEIEEARALVGQIGWCSSRARTIRFERPGVRINSAQSARATRSIASQQRWAFGSARRFSARLQQHSRDRKETESSGWVVGCVIRLFKDRRLAILGMRDCAMAQRRRAVLRAQRQALWPHNRSSIGQPAETVQCYRSRAFGCDC
jgi:hypothetical protein